MLLFFVRVVVVVFSIVGNKSTRQIDRSAMMDSLMLNKKGSDEFLVLVECKGKVLSDRC